MDSVDPDPEHCGIQIKKTPDPDSYQRKMILDFHPGSRGLKSMFRTFRVLRRLMTWTFMKRCLLVRLLLRIC